jgi:hypothetical protein
MTFPDSPPTQFPEGPPTEALHLGPATGEAPSVMPRSGFVLAEHPLLSGRTVMAMVLLFLAGVSVVAGFSAIWTRNQLLDTDTWTATSTAIATDPNVQADVAHAIAVEIVASSDVEAAISSALPGPLGQLAGPLTDGATSIVEQAVLQVVRTDAFVAVWEAAVRVTHAEFIADLEGEGRFTSIDERGLSLDLRAVLESVRTALDQRGITVLDQLDLSGVTVRVLLVDAPGLEKVRSAVGILKASSVAFLVIGAVLLIAGLCLARRRAIAVLSGGVGTLVGVAAVLIVATVGRTRAALQLMGGVLDRAAADAVVDHVTAGLRPLMLSCALLGVMAVVVGGMLTVRSERRNASQSGIV